MVYSDQLRILVTGGSSGIGRAVVEFCLARGFTVIATTRSPETQQLREHLKWIRLDLNDKTSVLTFCKDSIWDQRIDFVFNNAGFGLIAPIESADLNDVRRQFEANYFSSMQITQRAVNHFREHDQGTIMVNTSIGGRMAFPYFGYYNATKHALEASYEALWYEIKSSTIRVKIIEPGFTQTKFATHGMERSGEHSLLHKSSLRRLSKSMKEGTTATRPADVAEVIVRAFMDKTNRLRYFAGKHSRTLLLLRKIVPERWFMVLIKKVVLDS